MWCSTQSLGVFLEMDGIYDNLQIAWLLSRRVGEWIAASRESWQGGMRERGGGDILFVTVKEATQVLFVKLSASLL